MTGSAATQVVAGYPGWLPEPRQTLTGIQPVVVPEYFPRYSAGGQIAPPVALSPELLARYYTTPSPRPFAEQAFMPIQPQPAAQALSVMYVPVYADSGDQFQRSRPRSQHPNDAAPLPAAQVLVDPSPAAESRTEKPLEDYPERLSRKPQPSRAPQSTEVADFPPPEEAETVTALSETLPETEAAPSPRKAKLQETPPTPQPKPQRYAEHFGEDMGKIVAAMIQQNPDWEHQLEALDNRLGISQVMRNPQAVANTLPRAWQELPRAARYALRKGGKLGVQAALPKEMEPEGLRFYQQLIGWLDHPVGKPPV